MKNILNPSFVATSQYAANINIDSGDVVVKGTESVFWDNEMNQLVKYSNGKYFVYRESTKTFEYDPVRNQ